MAAVVIIPVMAAALLAGCNGDVNFLGKGAGVPLQLEEVDPATVDIGGNDVMPITDADETGGGLTEDEYKLLPIDQETGLHPMFGGILGVAETSWSMSVVSNDLSGYNAMTDTDGDGIPNEEELFSQFSNPDVSDCPRITARIETPIIMELRVDDKNVTQNHTELISDSDVKNTISNSMENKQYAQLNLKTTPYVTRDSLAWSEKHAGSAGYSMSMSNDMSVTAPSTEVTNTFKTEMSQNMSFENDRSRSTSSEKTVFENVNYVDNLNRNGTEFKDDTVERISKNFRQSGISKSDFVIEPDAGYVRASLFLINESRNMPVRISNVKCTLSFRTPSGNCLPVKTFKLRNEDYSEFEEEVYGGEELGPYAIEISGLNTHEVKKALMNGYMPQIHVVTYDMHRVENSNYNPGVDNLKIVEETAKSRTAIIKIIGSGVREMYRVPAFEVDELENVTPGISLKKALFKIYRDRIGSGEDWDYDRDGEPLTVTEEGIRWKTGFVDDPDRPGEYKYSSNVTGNNWNMFGTCVKSWPVTELVPVMDENNNVIGSEWNTYDKHIETIDRIGSLEKYNPFSVEDNPTYNEKEPLTTEQFYKMKYWIILHNGRYFEGDINDPIWAGERYEIILFDAEDFNERFKTSAYTPLMDSTGSGISSDDEDFVDFNSVQNDYDFKMNTLWNVELQNQSEFARSVYLGRVVRGDVIRLDIGLDEFRSLFDVEKPGAEFGMFSRMNGLDGNIWNKFSYTFDDGNPLPNGKPGSFDYEVMGGTNSIILRINKAENAVYYTATFWQSGEAARVVKILPKDLDENYNYYVINSVTENTAGDPIGVISEGMYYVQVRAHGSAYNVPVSTLGMLSNNGSLVSGATTASVSVEGVASSDYPGSFSVKALGMVNSMSLMINQSSDAEYYIAEVTGPYNYGHGNGDYPDYTPPVRTFIAHGGTNVFEISKNDSRIIGGNVPLTDEEKNWEVPGVFVVAVYAVNQNCPDGNCPNAMGDPDPAMRVYAQGDPETVFIDFNRYEEQKQYSPKPQVEAFDPKDVDLEVNFNDGSGWFTLKISDMDDYSDDRFINCDYTTSFQQNRGRVTLYFTAPTGSDGLQNTQYNVFRGGAEMVDVYLRTRAQHWYQDKLWLKSSEKDSYDYEDPYGYRCLNINSDINGLPGYDPLLYWKNNANNDVTMIENFDIYSNDPRLFMSPASMKNCVAEGDFGVVAPGGKSDFFFSPMKLLTYRIKASLVDVDLSNMMGEVSHVDNPEYRVKGGYQSVYVTNIDTQYADSWKIDWIQVNNTANYGSTGYFTAEPSNSSCLLGSLLPNESYKITVTAGNSISTSTPISYVVKTLPEATAYPLIEPWNYYGYGTFMDPSAPLTNEEGNLLLNNEDFLYEEPLDSGLYDIWDTGTSGDLASGKYLRIVEGGRNISTILSPVAKSLSGIIASPPNDECWIDPVRGTFVLPRPDYWCKLENFESILNPQIYEQDPTYEIYLADGSATTSYLLATCSGQFNSGISFDSPSLTGRYLRIYPFGKSGTYLNEGTISFWYSFTGAAGRWLKIYLGSNCYIYLDANNYAINYNDTVISQATYAVVAHPVFRHIYVSWKNDSVGLSDGATIKAYTNGDLPISMTNQWNATPISVEFGSVSPVMMDNLKVWKNVVSESSGWEYNNGTGREDAFNPVYGSANGYKPVLSGSTNGVSNGVGFYCIPQ